MRLELKKKRSTRIDKEQTAKRGTGPSRGRLDSGRELPELKLGRREFLIGAGLVVATLAVYAQVISHQFINLDDDIYIYENTMLAGGLSAKGLKWALTSFHAANWHPLTWLSHMLDVQMFGIIAGPHLAVNSLFHTLNCLLVFGLFMYMTNRVWRSAIVAALFALHPMHVESVAWAAERKDVLSTFFALLSLLAYVRYARTEPKSWTQFLPTTLLLALALLAKPMFVTWPFVMLLLDYWPLKRLSWHPADGLRRLWQGLAPLVREKIPIIALVAISIAITYIAQSMGGAVRQFSDAPLSFRLSNAVLSYARYILSLLWPTKLSVYYPLSTEDITLWKTVSAIALIAGVTVAVIRAGKSRGYLITGWAWYLGTLIPVIGLIQVGGQAMADRYTYTPSIGLFLVVVWGVSEIVARWQVPNAITAAIAVACLIFMGSLAWIQVGFWRDSITLYQHSLSVAPNNLVVHYNLAHALGKQGNRNEALTHFGEALRINPDYVDALVNTGVTLNELQRFGEATTPLTRALQLEPGSSKAHLQLGIALAQSNGSDQALRHFVQAMELAPGNPDVRTNLGLMLAREGRLSEAREHLNEAIRLNPDSPEAHNNLGLVLLMQGNPENSIPEFSTALRLKPEFKLARENLIRAQDQLKHRE